MIDHSTNELSFLHQDVLGNVIGLTDATGNITETYRYDIWGSVEVLDSTGTVQPSTTKPKSPFLFTAREWDHDLGLYHYRARAYYAELGRFMQFDPIGFKGSDLNTLRYVRNSCLRWIDPSGRNPELYELIHEACIRDYQASMELMKVNEDAVFHEYCGLICLKPCGATYETRKRGDGNTCYSWRAPCKSGDKAIGIHHSQPGGNNDLSPEDNRNAREGSHGFDPETGETFIPENTPIGATAKPFDREYMTGIYDPRNGSYHTIE